MRAGARNALASLALVAPAWAQVPADVSSALGGQVKVDAGRIIDAFSAYSTGTSRSLQEDTGEPRRGANRAPRLANTGSSNSRQTRRANAVRHPADGFCMMPDEMTFIQCREVAQPSLLFGWCVARQTEIG
jgi:hypothetical protein